MRRDEKDRGLRGVPEKSGFNSNTVEDEGETGETVQKYHRVCSERRPEQPDFSKPDWSNLKNELAQRESGIVAASKGFVKKSETQKVRPESFPGQSSSSALHCPFAESIASHLRDR